MQAFIQINEDDVEGLRCPFTILYLFEDKNANKARAILMKIHADSKAIGGLYRELDKIKKDEQE